MENVKQKSPFVLWLENYWYHYKWRTLLAVFLMIQRDMPFDLEQSEQLLFAKQQARSLQVSEPPGKKGRAASTPLLLWVLHHDDWFLTVFRYLFSLWWAVPSIPPVGTFIPLK